MPHIVRSFATLIAAAVFLSPGNAQSYTAPAGDHAAAKRLGAESVLPGGRLITPLGRQHVTVSRPLDVAVSPNGKRIVAFGSSGGLAAVSVFSRNRPALRRENLEGRKTEVARDTDGGVPLDFRGAAFDGSNRLFLSEGHSGRVRAIDPRGGETLRGYSLDQNGFRNSDAAGLALDARRKRLYVADRANSRLAVFDLGSGRLNGSVQAGAFPSRIALSKNGERAFVTSSSPPDAPGFDVLTVVDLSGAEPRTLKSIPVGRKREAPFGRGGLAGVLAAGDSIYVTSRRDDAVYVIDPVSLEVSGEIPLRIEGFENLRGIAPMGMAFDEARRRLYVAESGINAVAVIDAARRRVLGHLPAGWRPSALALHQNDLYVVNEKGQGTGPNATAEAPLPSHAMADFELGTLSEIALAETERLETHTARVMANNGFVPSAEPLAPIPGAIRYVVLVLKGNRSFDEVFGDLRRAANGAVESAPALARFGNLGFAQRERGGLARRGELRDVPVTPNHHALAGRFAFSDNFYRPRGGQERSRDMEAWAPALRRHLRPHGVTFRDFDEPPEPLPGPPPPHTRPPHAPPPPLSGGPPFYPGTRGGSPGGGTEIPDQFRADRFIREIEERYRKPGEDPPRLMLLRLPNDRMGPPRPDDGYPFRASYVADNDLALGRVVEYLSRSPWWGQMAILVAGESSGAGLDHVDAHRSILLVASPYARRNYVSHRNADFAAVLKMTLRMLGVSAMSLDDAAAADLAGCFTGTPDMRPYEIKSVERDLFDPEKAGERFAPDRGGPPMEFGGPPRNRPPDGP